MNNNFSVSLRRSALHFLESWKKSQITIRAAALTYTTILSLVPAIAICIFLFAKVAEVGEIPPAVKNFLLNHLTAELGDWLLRLTDFSSLPELFKDFLLKNLSAGTGEIVIEYLDAFISNVNFRAIGLAGFFSVLISSVLMLFAIEDSMNVIWRAPRNKTLIRRVILYLFALIFAPLLLAISFAMSTVISVFFPGFHIHAQIGSTLCTAFLLCAGLKFFPNTKIAWRYAAASGIATTIAVEILKFSFHYYTKQSMLYSALYGGLSALPFFLIWIYFNWIVFLAGTLLTYLLQNRRHLDKIGDANQWDPYSIFDRERAHLISQIMQLLRSSPRTMEQLLEKTDMPEFTVANALEWLRIRKWAVEERRGFHKFFHLSEKAAAMKAEDSWKDILGISEAEIHSETGAE